MVDFCAMGDFNTIGFLKLASLFSQFSENFNFFDDCVGLTQRPLEAKDRRPKPQRSGAGAVSIFGPIFTYINYNGVL